MNLHLFSKNSKSILVIFLLFLFFIFLIKATPSPQNNSTVKNMISTPTDHTPSIFNYDVSEAEKLLIQYIKNIIKPKFVPATIEVKQGQSINGNSENVNYEFGSQFTINKDLFSSNLLYKEGSTNQDVFGIFIQPNIIEKAVNAPLANSLLSNYFINPYHISDCKTILNSSYCESFQNITEGKRGYGILLTNRTGKITFIVFSCFIPKESKYYNTQNTCINP